MGAAGVKKVFLEGDSVRIASLIVAGRPFTGSAESAREPAVGDEGEITGLEPDVDPILITVDCIQKGALIWRAVFSPNELDRIEDEA